MARKQNDDRQSEKDVADQVEGNVDKIRDILFGGQMRDYEKRFDAIEKRLTQAMERVSRDLDRRIERLDAFTRREVDKLSEHLKAEKKDRVAEAKKGTGEIKDLTEQIETWFAEVDEQIASDGKEIRDALLDQGEDLSSQLREAREQLTSALHTETDVLNEQKLSREDMAAMLSELALRLNKNLKLPRG